MPLNPLAQLLLGVGLAIILWFSPAAPAAERPNIVLILADDLGFSDIGCYGSEIETPNLDRLAEHGLRFTQFYNAARCCPTRASLLSGLYPHQAGVGHMLENWQPPSYSNGLGSHCTTIAERLNQSGYRTYHVGKWHVGGLGRKDESGNHPISRGFLHAFGSGGGGNYFGLPLYRDRQSVEPGEDFYVTDAFSDNAVGYVRQHFRQHAGEPFFLHLCYTAPHFPLHAKPADIAEYRGKYIGGWDALREQRYAKQKQLGIINPEWPLSPRDPVAQAWADVPVEERDEWDLRMAVYAAMISCMDEGIGRVLSAIEKAGAIENTVVMFLSDNGSSAEFLDTWPNPRRGHKPGSVTGTRESHRCLEVGWSNASNTPFREHKMWVHEGGAATPMIVSWPVGISARGELTHEVGHVIDLMPTCLALASGEYPEKLDGRQLTPLPGTSLLPAFRGETLGARTLAWEHDGNRAIRQGDWKLVASFGSDWELYHLKADRTETNNLADRYPEKVQQLALTWKGWADEVGVVPWEDLPGSAYQPSTTYRKKSEPVGP